MAAWHLPAGLSCVGEGTAPALSERPAVGCRCGAPRTAWHWRGLLQQLRSDCSQLAVSFLRPRPCNTELHPSNVKPGDGAGAAPGLTAWHSTPLLSSATGEGITLCFPITVGCSYAVSLLARVRADTHSFYCSLPCHHRLFGKRQEGPIATSAPVPAALKAAGAFRHSRHAESSCHWCHLTPHTAKPGLRRQLHILII